MANDGQIVFEVTADGKHAIADIKEITRAIQQETGKWDAAAKQSTDNIGNNFSGMLKKLAAGFSAAKIGKALLDFGKDAIQAASDLQEVQNVVDTTFGTNANQIETWAKNAGTQFGLTETQAKKFTSTMGAMLKSSGLAGDQIVDVSTDLAGLAADMASFYNLDFEEAFSKIRSGISGMTMPLKELGIDMSVDTLNAFALAQGLDKTFSQMDQGEQTMLRYQYLMQATADAQGDFARTSDGYANSIRQLETNLTSLKTNIGEFLLPFVDDLVGALNSLFTDRSGERTVLDDFADIDANTAQKLENIRETASEAKLLAEELDAIAGTKADKASEKVQQIASGLAGINLDQGKAGIVKDFIANLAKDIPTLAEIQGTSAQGASDWLEKIGKAADSLDPDDAAGWATLMEEIRKGLPGLESTEEGSKFLDSLSNGLADVFAEYGVDSDKTKSYLDTLGLSTDEVAEKQGKWLELCKRLSKTIPGLNSVINTETGEIKGGTAAVQEYIKAWEDGQTKLVLLGALEQKESALSSRFSDLPGLQLDMALAERKLRQQKEKIEELAKKYNIDIDWYNGDLSKSKYSGQRNILTEDQKAWNDAVDALIDLQNAADEATKKYNLQKEALEEAKLALEEYRKTIDEMGGDVKAVEDETTKFFTQNAENIKTLTNAVAEATKQMDDYAKNVRDSVMSSIESTVKGFGKITTLAEKNSEDISKELKKLGKDAKKNANEIEALNEALKNAQGKKTTTSSQLIRENLQQQAQYMQNYLDALNQAKSKGLSADMLAQLSDGSVESYDVLVALAEAAPEEVKSINANYQAVIDKKNELADEMTDRRLAVDNTFKSLAESAVEAVQNLDQATPAEANAEKTMVGLLNGIQKYIPELSSTIDTILEQMGRLSGYGISMDFGGFGSINFTTSTGKTESSDRFGLNYVPHDDYIARLHEGERVLTSQENQIWNTLLNGGYSGFDLDSLGGVMRDNIKPGGNVYLDGKVVGNVISDQQGKSYRSLQRSGWQV